MGFRSLGSGLGLELGFRCKGLVLGSGVRVQVQGFGVSGPGIRVHGPGYRYGLGVQLRLGLECSYGFALVW